jgi:hypothetical protein
VPKVAVEAAQLKIAREQRGAGIQLTRSQNPSALVPANRQPEAPRGQDAYCHTEVVENLHAARLQTLPARTTRRSISSIDETDPDPPARQLTGKDQPDRAGTYHKYLDFSAGAPPRRPVLDLSQVHPSTMPRTRPTRQRA